MLNGGHAVQFWTRFWMKFRKWDKVLFRSEWVCNVTSSFSGKGFKTDPKTAWRHTLLPDTKVDIYLYQKKLLGSYSYWFLVVFSTGRSNKFVPRAAFSTSLPSFYHLPMPSLIFTLIPLTMVVGSTKFVQQWINFVSFKCWRKPMALILICFEEPLSFSSLRDLHSQQDVLQEELWEVIGGAPWPYIKGPFWNLCNVTRPSGKVKDYPNWVKIR